MNTAGPATTTTRTSPRALRPRGGLLDALLMGALVWGVYAATPLGALAETAVRVARGQKDHPSWFATFRGRELAATGGPGGVGDVATSLAGATQTATLAAAAAAHRIDEEALAALIAVRGSCDDEGRCTALAPDRLAALVPGKAGVVDVDALAAGLAAAGKALSTTSPEPAIEALFVGVPALQQALTAARRSALPVPDDVEVHAPFLSPGTRRGALQGALAVLHVWRLRALAWPGEGFPVTSSYGERIHPVTGERRFHNGTDIGMPVGTTLRAVHDATVARVGDDRTSGTYVVLDHGLGVQTSWCHLDGVDARPRARLRRLDPFARSGATGRVTGPHLHYVLRVNGQAVDAERLGARALTRAAAAQATTPAP
ncbi:MAG: M23 family metallopeptidase [Deltaproteobacteria bacterium]|nr:M23 family metallopeptidase [Deltaproteobacteria bacterium]